MYEVLQAGMRAWKHDARNTRRLESALNFLEIASVEHTGNQWIEDKNGMLFLYHNPPDYVKREARIVQNRMLIDTNNQRFDTLQTQKQNKETLLD